MKKILALILAILMAASYAACTGQQEQNYDGESPSPEIEGSNENIDDVDDVDLIDLSRILPGMSSTEIFSEFSIDKKQALKAKAASENIDVEFKADGTTVFTFEDGMVVVQNTDGSFIDGNVVRLWPDNELTKYLPPPIFDIERTYDSLEMGRFTANLSDVTVDEMIAYVEDLKEAGFVIDAYTRDSTRHGVLGGSASSGELYSYVARNAEGVYVMVSVSQGHASITITKH